jgi:glycosyltransferase involved in cell wall biosynthesis
VEQRLLSDSNNVLDRLGVMAEPGARSWLKIAYLNTTGELGGAEMCLLDLLAVLRAARPDWRLRVIVGDDGPMRAAVSSLGVPCAVLHLPRALARVGDSTLTLAEQGRRVATRLGLAARAPEAALATISYLTRLRCWLRTEAPDCLQTNTMKAHVLGVWAAPRGLPIIWHLHDYIGARPVMARLLRWSARRPLTAVVASRSVADDAACALGVWVPVQTIPYGVDLERFAPGAGDGDRLDAAAGLPPAPPGTIRVGLVAAFARWKGQEVFLEAAAQVPADRPCRFYLVGGPIYRSMGSQYTLDELRSRAASLGLGNRLGFTGFLDDPASAFRALDVVVHASTRPEPFGRVIIEAMACGRAVIAAPVGGAAELIDDGVSALSCPPGDPSALSAAIDRLIGHADFRRQLGAGGRSAVQARFDRNLLIEPWTTLYEGLGARTAAPPTN